MMIKGILWLIRGGGIYILIVILNLNAVELSSICKDANNCTLYENYQDITNHSNFKGGIQLNQKTITNFTNYNILGNISWGVGTITHITNYGTMGYIAGIRANNPTPTTMSVINYGIMGGIETQYGDKDIFIANYGIINPTNNNIHFWGTSSNQYHFVIVDYAMRITESASAFANSRGDTSGNNNSHIVIHSQGLMKFDNPNSKIILNFGGNFSFGELYPLDKLIIDTSGTNRLKVEFERLTTKSSLYKLTQSGDNFIVSLDAPNSEIGILNKFNVRTMNNFYTMSNSMIYPRKYSKSQNLVRKNSKNILSLRDLPTANRGNPLALSSLRASVRERGNPFIKESIDSALSLKSYESFAYRNESQTRRIQRQNKRNYSRNVKDSSLRASASERGNPKDLRAKRSNHPPQNLAQNPHDYYFILTPFINHNLFFKSGRYNLSGFDYGFLTAFSGKITPSNTLGAHFMMSYGSLGDSHDKDFHISNLNLNLGLNYKLDLIWDSYLKARGDFFYFLNQVKTLTMREAIKPNNLGFGVSVSYGKDFDFKQGGILGIEGGIDYKALSASEITLDSINETYLKSLYNVLYVDLGMSYAKYFGNFGFNANLGIKGNITANKLAKSKIILNNFNRSVDMVLDNDKILGYVNLAGSYVLNYKNFDIEFSLAYYGNYGDRILSNGGGFEWRVTW